MMCFERLNEANNRGELLLVDRGMCHYRHRRDKQITIHEIFSQRPGAGSEILDMLKATPGATSVFAKCPTDLPANEWYERRGFMLEKTETLGSGRKINHWRLAL